MGLSGHNGAHCSIRRMRLVIIFDGLSLDDILRVTCPCERFTKFHHDARRENERADSNLQLSSECN